MSHAPYGFSIDIDRSFDDTVAAVRGALAAEGFGVLTEADLQATFLKKLGVQVPPYVILGACSPAQALEGIRAEPDLGLLLPCNVIVRRDPESGRTHVAVLDPVAQLALAGHPALEPVAVQVRDRLRRALVAVERAA